MTVTVAATAAVEVSAGGQRGWLGALVVVVDKEMAVAGQVGLPAEGLGAVSCPQKVLEGMAATEMGVMLVQEMVMEQWAAKVPGSGMKVELLVQGETVEDVAGGFAQLKRINSGAVEK